MYLHIHALPLQQQSRPAAHQRGRTLPSRGTSRMAGSRFGETPSMPTEADSGLAKAPPRTAQAEWRGSTVLGLTTLRLGSREESIRCSWMSPSLVGSKVHKVPCGTRGRGSIALVLIHSAVYVASDGALQYTEPHSAALPEGAVTTGFQRPQSEVFPPSPIYLDISARAWAGCPVVDAHATGITYQVYSVDQGSPKTGCSYFQMRTYAAQGSSAWEYI